MNSPSSYVVKFQNPNYGDLSDNIEGTSIALTRSSQGGPLKAIGVNGGYWNYPGDWTPGIKWGLLNFDNFSVKHNNFNNDLLATLDSSQNYFTLGFLSNLVMIFDDGGAWSSTRLNTPITQDNTSVKWIDEFGQTIEEDNYTPSLLGKNLAMYVEQTNKFYQVEIEKWGYGDSGGELYYTRVDTDLFDLDVSYIDIYNSGITTKQFHTKYNLSINTLVNENIKLRDFLKEGIFTKQQIIDENFTFSQLFDLLDNSQLMDLGYTINDINLESIKKDYSSVEVIETRNDFYIGDTIIPATGSIPSQYINPNLHSICVSKMIDVFCYYTDDSGIFICNIDNPTLNLNTGIDDSDIMNIYLSGDGTTIAVSTLFYSNNRQKGEIKVYNYMTISNLWFQVGNAIKPLHRESYDIEADYFARESLTMSNSKDIVVSGSHTINFTVVYKYITEWTMMQELNIYTQALKFSNDDTKLCTFNNNFVNIYDVQSSGSTILVINAIITTGIDNIRNATISDNFDKIVVSDYTMSIRGKLESYAIIDNSWNIIFSKTGDLYNQKMGRSISMSGDGKHLLVSTERVEREIRDGGSTVLYDYDFENNIWIQKHIYYTDSVRDYCSVTNIFGSDQYFCIIQNNNFVDVWYDSNDALVYYIKDRFFKYRIHNTVENKIELPSLLNNTYYINFDVINQYASTENNNIKKILLKTALKRFFIDNSSNIINNKVKLLKNNTLPGYGTLYFPEEDIIIFDGNIKQQYVENDTDNLPFYITTEIDKTITFQRNKTDVHITERNDYFDIQVDTNTVIQYSKGRKYNLYGLDIELGSIYGTTYTQQPIIVEMSLGWNLIGSSYASLITDVSNIYIENTYGSYSNGSYVLENITEPMVPNKGYFIKTSQSGNIHLTTY